MKILLYCDVGRNAQGVRIGVQAGDPPDVLNGVDCKGTERNITECPHDTDDTCVFSGAGVICPAVLNGLLRQSFAIAIVLINN